MKVEEKSDFETILDFLISNGCRDEKYILNILHQPTNNFKLIQSEQSEFYIFFCLQ